MSKKIFLPLFLAAILAMCGFRASAQGPNGTHAKPFYVIAHNPNAISDADQALQCSAPGDPCANALEPDIIVLPTSPPPVDLSGNLDPTGLVVYHDFVVLTSRVPATLPEYLTAVHDLAIAHPQLALIMLDIKPSAATPDRILEIWNDVQTFLNFGDVHLNVIYNVAERSEIDAFGKILPLLKEREGVQVDDDNNAELVVNDFLGAFFVHNLDDGNISWGDGTLGLGPNLPKAVDFASYFRATTGYPKLIGDVYTIEFESSMSFFMDAGADGIIPDFPDALHPEYDERFTATYISNLQDVLKQHPEFRLATREDNPFKPENQAYGLEVTTLDNTGGGTDAPLTFTLEGCRGTSEVTVHTGIGPSGIGTGRMEAGQTDHVTIPSLDLGKLTKLHVQNHGGFFNFPNWDLGTVAIGSMKYLGSNVGHGKEYRATFNKTIKGDTTVNIDLTPAFPEPPPTIECPGTITVDNTPGKCSAAVNFTTPAAGMCNDVTTSSNPASGAAFDVGITEVSATASSPTTGSASCSFKVAVKDTESPLLGCPGPQIVNATSSLGALVTFAPSAADNCSVSNVTSTPPSGSQFAIGDTLVTSVAQDPSGNVSSCSFNVHVKGASEQITDLITIVNNLPLDAGNKNALLVKLQQALDKLADSNGGPVCGPLKSFINEVSALSGKSISTSDADYLIAQATAIRLVVGC